MQLIKLTDGPRAMMSRRSVLTQVTPIPSYIPRQFVLDMLHDHDLMITLNPLVTRYVPCAPPAHALPDEYDSAWYEITDRIEYIPGTPLVSNVTYTACLHDIPTGVQSHVHAPAGLEIRGKWQVLGSEPGEKRHRELGEDQYGIPKEGLYLREDCEVRCNFLLMPTVRRNLKKSHATLVDRLLERAKRLVQDTNNSNNTITRTGESSGSLSVGGSGFPAYSSGKLPDEFTLSLRPLTTVIENPFDLVFEFQQGSQQNSANVR